MQPDMNKKAANSGDQLKHTLLLEVLNGARAWPSVAYSETHTGAGIYRSENQTAGFIADLRERVLKENLGSADAGSAYLKWLKIWWRLKTNRDSYPGSALTALRWL